MSIFKQHIDAMTAYTPPLEGRDPHNYTLLDFNERTIEVVDHVREALVALVESGRLHMYPSYGDLTSRIANYCGLLDCQVMITNGSDQGIDLIIRSACGAGDEIIIPVPTFAMYHQSARIENLVIHEPEYTQEGGYPIDAVLALVNSRTRCVVIANPNNPCGSLVSPQDVLRIARAIPDAAILVDECYFEYSRTSVAAYVDQYPNLVITRTFSKTWGLPSIRLGYVLSRADNIKALLNVRGPYDVNQFAVAAVTAALEKPELSLAYVDEVMEVSKPRFEEFLQSRGVSYWASAANFLWVFPDNPKRVESELRKAHILVRPKVDARGDMGLRITIGTEAQTQQLISVLEGVL